MNIKISTIITLLILVASSISTSAGTRIYDIADFGLTPDSGKDASAIVRKAVEMIKSEHRKGDKTVLRFTSGRYDFFHDGAEEKIYYISNHDQDNPKRVGIVLDDMENFTLDGQGSEFVFHGRMLPLAITHSTGCTLKNFSIDFADPQIAQAEIVANDPNDGVTIKFAEWVNYHISEEDGIEIYGDGWTSHPALCIAFAPDTKHILYNSGDISYSTKGAIETVSRTINIKGWKDMRLTPGTLIAMRTWQRPAPGIFLYEDVDTSLSDIKIHFAEGMGLLAQMCENIELHRFCVCLKGANDPRCFTTQADATHFSGCKGKITSVDGLYENIMDDAINVHGTYLKVIERIDSRTLRARYMHDQAWGFDWGYADNEVQFVRSMTMETVGDRNTISSIYPCDRPQTDGAREFIITFVKNVDSSINGTEGFGIENLTYTPEVLFARNIIRNNRARGALFSTPRRTVVEDNLFDHTSGSAILLCGDCNGWYETGACRDVTIRRNLFINSLTSMYQFTNAIISICPEIPDLDAQTQYFHGGKAGKGIVIENNVFETFDHPVLYIKSADGVVFRRNRIIQNNDYPPFHPNKERFLLERTTNVIIK